MNRSMLELAYKPIKTGLIIASVFYFLRGHNQPGGGFIGALLISVAFLLQAMAISVEKAKKSMVADPITFIILGIFVAILSALPGLLQTGVPMSGVWVTLNLPIIGDLKLGTPLLFDFGVYLTVFGVITTMSFQFLNHITWK